MLRLGLQWEWSWFLCTVKVEVHFFCPQMSNCFSTMVEKTALLFNRFCTFVNSHCEIFNYRFNFLMVLGLIRLSSLSCGVWSFGGCEKLVHFFPIVKFWSAWYQWLMYCLFLCKSVLLEIYQCYCFFFSKNQIFALLIFFFQLLSYVQLHWFLH